MDISVRAKSPGTYQNRYMERGDVFVIEEKMFSSVWMEKLAVHAPLKQSPKDHRSEPRDPGEHEQHLAEKRGLVPEPKV